MQKGLKKILSVSLCFLMLMPLIATAASGAAAELQNTTSSYNYPLSYRGESFTVPAVHNAVKKNTKTYAVQSDSVLPSSFDMRSVSGALPAVRDQNPYGTCWAFSSIIAAETDMIKDGLADNTIDLSELNLVYNTYRQVSDPLGNFDGDYNVIGNGQTMMDVGGNGMLATLALARWGGVTKEEVMPYADGAFACGYNYPNEYASEMDIAHLQNAYWLNLNSEADAAKSFILNGNAVGMAYWEDHSSYNETTSAYCQKVQIDTNHAVAIVGWDDNFSKNNFSLACQPNSDGAWLIRNSWGSEYGEDGYFWLSYEDSSLQYVTAYVYDFESADNYDRNYQYDGSSGLASFSIADKNVLTTANVYTAQSNEVLRAVSFMNPQNTNVDYTVKIYKNPTDATRPSSGELVATKSGNETYCGYHTVVLNNSVTLSAGDKFVVAITLAASGEEDISIAYEDSYNYNWMRTVSAFEAGQSFVSQDGINWVDFSQLKDGNIRIKAFTDVVASEKPTGLTGVLDNTTVSLTWNAVDGALSYDIYKKGENESEYSLLYNSAANSYSYTANTADGITTLYKVRAVSSSGTSDFSSVISLTLPITRHLSGFDMCCNDNYEQFTIQLGSTAQVITDPYPAAATDKLIAFSCDNTNVATINSNGVVTAVGYGNATITGVARDSAYAGIEPRTLVVRVPQTINVSSVEGMQSAHNYKEYTEQLYVYTKTNAESISVTFSTDTFTTAGRDYIKIYNSANVLQGTYSGNQLAGKTITVQGNTFKLLFQTDRLGTDYGFRATAITYTGGDLDTALLTQYINEADLLNAEDYTTSTWNTLQTAITSARALFTDPSATQEDVNNAATAIRTAIDSLEDYISLEEISISAPGLTNGVLKIIIPAGESLTSAQATLTAVGSPTAAEYSLDWSCDDNFIISVNSNGQISCGVDYPSYCTVTVTATDARGNEVSDSIVVAVIHYDTQIVTVTPSTLSLATDAEPYTLDTTITDINGNPSDIYDLTWISSDDSVVTVNNGVVTVVGNGNATITATADFGGAYDTCLVSVGTQAHTHSYTATVIQPTCTSQGYTEYTCSCGDTYKTDYTEKAPHTEGLKVTENQIDSTCSVAGKYDEVVYCTVCEAEISRTEKPLSLAAHTPSVLPAKPATCTATGLTEGSVCSVCHTVLVGQEEIQKTAHTAGAAVQENVIAATCSEKGSYNLVTRCTVCGQIMTSEAKTTEKLPHTPSILPAKPATCTATGLTEGSVCSVCHTVLVGQEEIQKTAHTAGAAVQENVIAATCSEKGSYNLVTRCTVCGQIMISEAKTTEKLPHTASILPAKPATCTATGLTEGSVCSVCHTVLVGQEEIQKTAHTAGAAVQENVIAATCSEKGSYNLVTRCTVCGQIMTSEAKTTEKLPHTPSILPAKPATCTATGLTEGSVCSVCHTVLVGQEEIPKTVHTAGAAVQENVIAATCSEKGSYNLVTRCTVCGQIMTSEAKTTEKLPHTPSILPAKTATCTATGITEGSVCSVCNEILVSQTEISKLPHTPSVIPAKAATCTATGLTEGSICSVCNTVLTAQTVIGKTPHSYTGGYRTEPSCTSKGSVTYTCTVCQNTKTDEIAALGHKDADSNGICDVCGENMSANCSCMCHSTNSFKQFIYKIMVFFWKLFGIKKVCECGKTHY